MRERERERESAHALHNIHHETQQTNKNTKQGAITKKTSNKQQHE
jgi:hypothetical protein